MSQQQHCSKSEQRVIKDVVLFTGQTATNGTKYHSINYHCEKEKKNQAQKTWVMQLGQRRVPPRRPLQQPLSQSMKPRPRSEGLHLSPCDWGQGVVLASWSGMCASEELVRKWNFVLLATPFVQRQLNPFDFWFGFAWAWHWGLADRCPEDGEPPGEAELACIAEGKALFCSRPTGLGASMVWVKLDPWDPGGRNQDPVGKREPRFCWRGSWFTWWSW